MAHKPTAKVHTRVAEGISHPEDGSPAVLLRLSIQTLANAGLEKLFQSEFVKSVEVR